ncbi:MAG TPA: hypothetical protein VFB58_16250 [Chloroflexota bacterium]|nr:hypothetical protein [Chloroflexota bacterium]
MLTLIVAELISIALWFPYSRPQEPGETYSGTHYLPPSPRIDDDRETLQQYSDDVEGRPQGDRQEEERQMQDD